MYHSVYFPYPSLYALHVGFGKIQSFSHDSHPVLSELHTLVPSQLYVHASVDVASHVHSTLSCSAGFLSEFTLVPVGLDHLH